MIRAKGLSYNYAKGTSLSFPDFQFENDGLIIGPSGIGKTTLLHLIGGLLTPKQGDIIINEKNICKLSRRELDQFRSKEIGMVFQHSHYVKAITVSENLLLIQKIAGYKQDSQAIHQLLHALNLENQASSYPNNLSQGQKQRLSIAMAIINEPRIILADEPTASLDDDNADRVINLLLNQARKHHAQLVVITHDHRIKSHFENTLEL